MNEHRTRAEQTRWTVLVRSQGFPRFFLLALGIWLHAADELVIATILTEMIRDIGGLEKVSWNLALYEMGSVLAGAAMGLQVARWGIRAPYIIATSAYITGCCVSALAPTMDIMLLGRLFQGLGGGGLVALAFISVERMFERAVWPQLFALLSAIWGGSAFAGPLIGGLFAHFDWWRGAFWCFALQAALLLCAVYLFIPNLKPGEKQSQEPQSTFPGLRLAILAVSILAIGWAATAAHVSYALSAISLGLCGLALTIYIDQKHARKSILPRSVLKVGSTAHNGLILVFTLAAGAVSFTIFAPLLLRELHHISSFAVGYIIALESIGWSTAAILIAKQPRHREGTVILAGTILAAIAVPGFAIFMNSGPIWVIAILALLQGAGFGLFWSFLIGQVVDSVPEHEKSIASAAIPLVQRIAYATGAAIAGIVANSAGFSSGLNMLTAQSVAVWVFLAFIPLLMIASVAAFKMSKA